MITINLNNDLEPLFDDYLIEEMKNLVLELNEPTAHDIVINLDKPWEGHVSTYFTLLYDKEQSLYKLYYRGRIETDPFNRTCYLESKDGINWVRPNLGLFEFEGSKENNIIWISKTFKQNNYESFCPFIDTCPKTIPEEKYKALGSKGRFMDILASPDGIHWKILYPDITKKSTYDSQNVCFWDEKDNLYYMFHRIYRNFTAKHHRRRDIFVRTSLDLQNWSKGKYLNYDKTGIHLYEMYTNGIQKYYRNPKILIGLPNRYCISRDNEISQEISDTLFMTSRDRLNWKRYDYAFLKPGHNHERWDRARNNMIVLGLIEKEDEIIFLSNEGYYGPKNSLRYYSLRIDGFTRLRSRGQVGELITKRITFKGKNLCINFSTSAAGWLKFELLNDDNGVIEGYDKDDCELCFGDEIKKEVKWKNDYKDLIHLNDKVVKLKIYIFDGDLFSFQFI